MSFASLSASQKKETRIFFHSNRIIKFDRSLVKISFYFKTLAQIKINCFRDIFLSLYLFRALILSSRPITEVVKISNINNLELKKNLKVLQRQIYELVNQIKNYGKVSRDEFDQIIFEAWDSFDEEVEKFKKLLVAIKLLFILFFVFTGFLFVIFLSFKSFNL